ncbi:MAG: DUF47 domain-containing protein [Planctomycetota bacterium]|nr:DUF47 domain-containing protein [Planctomycetota bacterium]
MFGVFISKDKAFYEMFDKAATNAVDAANALNDFLSKFPSSIPDGVKKMKDIEHKGDLITHETIEMLNKTFVTPIDREDIYHLITRMDDIVDLMDGAVSRLALYKIDKITPEAIALAQVLKNATEILHHSITGMRNIKNPTEIIKHCVQIHTYENEGDQLMQKALADLFENDKNDPIKVIKWKEIYQDLETATDRCEDVANIIEGIVLKYA